MWWYNIIGDNEVSISGLLMVCPTAGYALLTANLVALKREHSDPILTFFKTEWRKFIGYFGLSIEADPSMLVKKNLYFVHIGYITRPSSVNIHIESHHIDK